jgi:hypothetical protein
MKSTDFRNADYIIMTNRISFHNKKTKELKSCFAAFRGDNFLSVSRMGVHLSVVRKIKQ